VDRVGAFVALALGSNLGDRLAHLTWAVEALATVIDELRVSTIIETEPVGLPDFQPPFLNAVAAGYTKLAPRDLLAHLLDFERRQGRERPFRWAPRTLDLDLVLYDELVIDEPDLVVPHPRFRERAFVLAPLAEVAPAWRDPLTGKTAGELLGELGQGG
jgi:2-amino-4-hydroxy-6-hydroxymethyldihydropteridine diphosphokinase